MPGGDEGRRVCLAIGVANAKPLDWLPGAANAARDIGDWARCSGFDAVTVLTDEASIGQSRWAKGQKQPRPIKPEGGLAVTTARIGEEVGKLLPAGEATEWFVLHFAGHGLRQDLTRTLWLPSDWSTANRAVAVESLKAALEFHGIENLTIISDACRDFANRPATANLNADGVLGKGPMQPSQPALDRFNAVEDGKPAFMVPGATPADARCILSGTITNALWGHEPKAFHRHAPGQVLSDSLLRFIATEAKAVGERYGLDSKAETVRGYGSDNPDRVYFDPARPPEPRAPPIVWPPPKPLPPPPDTLPETAVDAAVERIERIEGIRPPVTKGGPGGRAAMIEWIDGGRDLAFAIEWEAELGLSARRRRNRAWHTSIAEEAVKRALERQSRESARSTIRTALREGQRRASTHANLILRGGRPVRIWSPEGATRLGRTKSWAVEAPHPAGAQVIVEYDDGLFAPLVVYPGLDTVAAHDGAGRITGWMCVPPDAAGTANLSTTTDAISRLQTTRLPPAEADALATRIRHEKHLNPMLGAIAAYLYDYIGDRDNIRRMAWYYADYGQPIPYDIALLGLIETRFDGEGRLVARIPAVPPRAPDPARPAQPEFATRATRAREGVVAGRCPWLRQGWDYVAAPEDVEKAMTVQVWPALPHLLDSSFTALSREGAETLIQTWRLEADR